MYEEYYGFTEKPFSLTPDPKYLFKSESHANAFELLQYAVRRREGFVVVTGDIGTGKTTLCRALLEEIDRNTFTALVLNPFLTEEDLLKLILQDFGVVSREDVKSGRLANVSKQELIETIYDFLLGLLPLKASAVLLIDEAQKRSLEAHGSMLGRPLRRRFAKRKRLSRSRDSGLRHGGWTSLMSSSNPANAHTACFSTPANARLQRVWRCGSRGTAGHFAEKAPSPTVGSSAPAGCSTQELHVTKRAPPP